MISVAAILMAATCVMAQQSNSTVQGKGIHNPIKDGHRWGAEVMLPGLAGNAYILQFTRTLWKNDKRRGDFLIGTFNWIGQETPIAKKSSDPKTGEINIHTFPIGYRQYLYKGLNIELQAAPGFELKKDLNKNKYDGFRMGVDAVLAYKYDFHIGRLPFYAIAAANIHVYTYQANPLPGASTAPDEFGVYPLLWLGYRF